MSDLLNPGAQAVALLTGMWAVGRLVAAHFGVECA